MENKILDGSLMVKALKGSVALLEKNKEEVDSLNVFPVPDGDTGTNMSLTIKSSLKHALLVKEDNASKVALGASEGSLMGARGNSGVILSQLFRGFANGLDNKDEVGVKDIAKGLKEAADTAYKAVMKPTEGTILTVARECGEFAMKIWTDEEDILLFLKRVIDHGNMILNKTPDMLPVLKQAGVVDAGGKGFMYVLIGAYNALSGIEIVENMVEEIEVKTPTRRAPIETDDIKYGYCTELIINTKYQDINKLKKELSEIGDSLMVVGGNDLIKIHVHTNDPGLVLQKGTALGQLDDIKIDNMRYEHEETLFKEEEIEEEISSNSIDVDSLEELETKKYSFVAISMGEGIDKVFKELDVDYIVSGGQTMNPSTEDIFKAIEKTKGENIFILPNNKNIVLAAEQTQDLTERNVVVIPTKSIPEGVSALISFDEDESVEENRENMLESIDDVTTGEVTYAVRDTKLNGKTIAKDDIIGISDGDILTHGKGINSVSEELILGQIDEDDSLLTIFYGKDIDEEAVEELIANLEGKLEDIDIETIYGGQPLYYYIFSVE